MYRGQQIGVVVPAYNEAKLIRRVIDTMPDFVDRIYVVDDHSGDSTCEIVAACQREQSDPGRLELIRHAENRGVGAAIVTGYKRAARDGIDIVAVMAGDAQMDPADLQNLIEPVALDHADYVKGNRLFTGEAWRTIPRHRYLGNAVLSLLTKIASGYWDLADSQTGYTAISRRCLETLPLDRVYPRYGYPNHVLVMLNVFEFRVMDVPVRPVYNIGERSGIKLRQVIPRMSWLLAKQFMWRMKEKYVIRDFHPLLMFYALGFTLLVLCAPLTLRLLWLWLSMGRIPMINALAAMCAGIAGLQSTFFAMWFDMEHNRDLRPTHNRRYLKQRGQSLAQLGGRASWANPNDEVAAEHGDGAAATNLRLDDARDTLGDGTHRPPSARSAGSKRPDARGTDAAA